MRSITAAEHRVPSFAARFAPLVRWQWQRDVRTMVVTALVLLAGSGRLGEAHAQAPGTPSPAGPRPRAELRLDGFSATVDALHLGGGMAFPIGTYARIAGLLGAGVARSPGASEADDETGFSARADLLVRFHLDPVRQSRWGPYAAGGVSVRSDFEECCRGNLTLLLGVEGPGPSGRTWAFELGFGGGVRAGVALRGGGGRWR